MNNEEILKNAPEGWTHFICHYFRIKQLKAEIWDGFKWVEYEENHALADLEGARLRADIERIVELEKRIKEQVG